MCFFAIPEQGSGWKKEVREYASKYAREYASTREKLVDPVWFDNQGWEYWVRVPGYSSASATVAPRVVPGTVPGTQYSTRVLYPNPGTVLLIQ